MINYWYHVPFVYRCTNAAEYEYYSYDNDEWIRTYDVPHKQLIHIPETMAWLIINKEMEERELDND